jgi:hypothetical protein
LSYALHNLTEILRRPDGEIMQQETFDERGNAARFPVALIHVVRAALLEAGADNLAKRISSGLHTGAPAHVSAAELMLVRRLLLQGLQRDVALGLIAKLGNHAREVA